MPLCQSHTIDINYRKVPKKIQNIPREHTALAFSSDTTRLLFPWESWLVRFVQKKTNKQQHGSNNSIPKFQKRKYFPMEHTYEYQSRFASCCLQDILPNIDNGPRALYQ